MKAANLMKHEIATKKSEIVTLYTDMDGLYESHGKSEKIQKELDVKLKHLEEKFLQISMIELKIRQELQEKTISLEEALRSLHL